jgi:hypothetical protein
VLISTYSLDACGSSADFSVRERLKDILRQYELREKHFECVIRSKELEVLLSKARAQEQKQLADGERQIAGVAETQVRSFVVHGSFRSTLIC